MDVENDSWCRQHLKKNINILSNYLVFFDLVIIVLSFIYGHQKIVLIAARMAIGFIGWYLFLYGHKYSKVVASVIIYALFLLISGLSSGVLNENIPFERLILTTVGDLGFALLLLHTRINTKLAKILYYLIIAFLCYKILFGGGAQYIFKSSSKNYVSIVIFIFLFPLFVIGKNLRNYKLLLAVFIGLIVAVIVGGRSGILCLGGLTILTYVVKYFGVASKKNIFINCLLMLTGILTAIYLLENSSVIMKLFPRFAKAGFDLGNSRGGIWLEYIRGVIDSPISMLFGKNLSGFENQYIVRGNLHNSFLNMHYRYGLIFTLLNLSCLLERVFYFKKNKNYIMLVFLLAFLARASSDLVFADHQGNFILYYFILGSVISRTQRNNIKAVSKMD